jgi:hypothetical protein
MTRVGRAKGVANMKLRKLLVVSCLAIAIAALSPAAAFGKSNGTSRPLQVTGSGVLTFDPAGTYVIDGTEQASHMGRSTFHVEGVCTNADCSTSTYTTTTTAANGDTLTDSSTSSSNGVTFTNLDTFTGGTGRFAGASGSSTTTGTEVGTSNPFVTTLTFTSTGTISY